MERVKESVIERALALGWKAQEAEEDEPEGVNFLVIAEMGRDDIDPLLAHFSSDCPWDEAVAYLDGYQYALHLIEQGVVIDIPQRPA